MRTNKIQKFYVGFKLRDFQDQMEKDNLKQALENNDLKNKQVQQIQKEQKEEKEREQENNQITKVNYNRFGDIYLAEIKEREEDMNQGGLKDVVASKHFFRILLAIFFYSTLLYSLQMRKKVFTKNSLDTVVHNQF